MNKVKSAYNKKAGSGSSSSSSSTSSTTSSSYTRAKFIKDVNAILGTKTASSALAKTITISSATNKHHKLVTPLERYMKSLGYYDGDIEADKKQTPSFGSGMTAAIKEYQKNVVKATTKNQDGVISAKGATWKKLLNV